MALKTKLEWLVVLIYSYINLYIVSQIIFDKNGLLFGVVTQSYGNLNLLALSLALFLNTAIIIYLRLIKNRRLEGVILIIYSYLNLRVILPFLLNTGWLFAAIVGVGNSGGSANNLLGMILGLSSNALLIIYWLNRQNSD